MLEGGFNNLLLDLYACPTESTRWAGALDRMRDVLRVRSAALQVLRAEDDRIRVRWSARDSESQADRGHQDPFISGDENPRLRYAPMAVYAPGMFIRDRDYFEAGDRELAQLHGRLADLGLGSCLTASVALPSQDRLVLVLHRSLSDRRSYSGRDEALVGSVMPHLRQAISLAAELEAARQDNRGLRQGIDRMAFGLVLCRADARPCWVNRAAKLAFASRDGLWLRQERLAAGSTTDTDTLRRLIAQAGRQPVDGPGSGEQCLALSRSVDGSALHVIIVPLRHEADGLPGGHARLGGAEVLLLFSRTSSTPVLPAELVARLFALSPAESRLAIALCQGHSVNDYAAAHGITVGTARFQLKQVLAKTQAPRQSDLIRRVCTSVVAHAMRAEE